MNSDITTKQSKYYLNHVIQETIMSMVSSMMAIKIVQHVPYCGSLISMVGYLNGHKYVTIIVSITKY